MTEFANQRLDVGGDDGFVLDDQHVSGQFGVDVGLRPRDQLFDLGEFGVQDLGGLGRREALQRGQQESLARTGRDTHQAMSGIGLGRQILARLVRLRLQLGAAGAPDGMEHVVERNARRQTRIQ